MFCCFLFLALSEPPEGDENALTFPTFSEWFFKPNKHQPPVQQERVMKFAKRSLRSAAKSEDFAINFLTGLLLKSGVTNEDINSNKLSDELTKFVNFLSSSNSFIDSASYNQMLADTASQPAPEEKKEAPQKPNPPPKRREKRKAKKSDEKDPARKPDAKKSEETDPAQKHQVKKSEEKDPAQKSKKKNSLDPQAVQWTFQQPMNVQYPMQFVPVQYVVPQYAQQVNSDAKMRKRRHHRRAHKHT